MKNQIKAIMIVLMLVASPLSAFAQKTIFAVESYHAEYPWDAGYRKALEETLGAKYKLTFFEMDTKRVPADQYQKMSDLAWQKYLALKPDLVVLGDDSALKFLATRFSGTKTPVVYLGINGNPRTYVPETAENFTGVLERPLLKRSIAYIQTMIPGTKKIVVLFDASVTAQIVKKESFEDKDSVLINGITVDLKLLGTMKAWQDAIPSLKGKYDACVVGLFQSVVDAEGKAVDGEDLIAWVSKNSQIPPFAFWDFGVGENRTIGGLVLYGKDMGIMAAGVVKKVLEEGKAPKSLIPIFNDQGLFLFGKAQLAKWRIILPKDILATATLID
jgi:ABC-type uncharacterized transport system substrate-binding protein